MIEIDDPIHQWFELTYAAYLVIPRSILQSAPVDWQKKFVALLEELDNVPEFACPITGEYHVYLRATDGRFIHDEFRDYERGRRKIEYKRWPK